MSHSPNRRFKEGRSYPKWQKKIDGPCHDLLEYSESMWGILAAGETPFDEPLSVEDYFDEWKGYLLEYTDGYEFLDCETLFTFYQTISSDTPGYDYWLPKNLCDPDTSNKPVKSDGPKGYYPPREYRLMSWLCPHYCPNCQTDYPDNTSSDDCDCWANGEDYMAFGWQPSPGCCYGCMDESDWYYDSWATCHMQEACKDNENGMDWPWINSGTGGPVASDIGCEPEDER